MKEKLSFRIIEFDRDYRTVTDIMIKEFKSKEDANDYCKEISWTGYDYFAEEIK